MTTKAKKRRTLKDLRKSTGKTQQEVADAIGVSRATISRFENQGVNILVSDLAKLGKELGCEFELAVKLDQQCYVLKAGKPNQGDR